MKLPDDVFVTWHSDYRNHLLLGPLSLLESRVSNVFGLDVALSASHC